MPGYKIIRPLIFGLLPPERAHDLTISLLARTPVLRRVAIASILRSKVAGLEFVSPVGLAAGFDKNAQAPQKLLALGFGSVEVGTLTPKAQDGNPKPRLFRLVEDDAIINRMGFNNRGLGRALPRIRRARKAGVVGINIGANKTTTNKIDDYVAAYDASVTAASYITLNISSPNTPGLRNLQTSGNLDSLLSAIAIGRRPDVPLFVKFAPDLDRSEIASVCNVCKNHDVNGIIVSNTTVSQRADLKSLNKTQEGGLSGRPLRRLALETLRSFRSELGSSIPLIGVGGIFDAEDAYERIRAGASLIQLYTALAYEGPGLAARINSGLAALLKRDGFGSVSEAVGIDAPVTSRPATAKQMMSAFG